MTKNEVASTEKPINVWDMNAVRNKIEDSIRSHLNTHHDVIEHHTIFNFRLLLSIITVSFPITALIYDKLHPFPESRFVLALCVCGYFISVSMLTLFMYLIERQCFYQGRLFINSKSKSKSSSNDDTASKSVDFQLRSKTKRYSHIYKILVNITTSNVNAGVGRFNFVHQFSIGDVFTQSGFICKNQLRQRVDKVVAEIEKRVSIKKDD